MNDDLTDITLLLDRSGSMETVRDDVVGGVNAFIEEQKKAQGDAVFSLVQYDSVDPQEVVINACHIQQVGPLTEEDYTPRSGTPLRDAMGHCIASTGERLKAVDESARPGKVVFVVFTDGCENSSVSFSQKQLKEIVRRQQDVYSWQFVFLGADIDAFAQAEALGGQRGRPLIC